MEKRKKTLSTHWLRLVVAISRLFSTINVILVRHTISRAIDRTNEFWPRPVFNGTEISFLLDILGHYSFIPVQ